MADNKAKDLAKKRSPEPGKRIANLREIVSSTLRSSVDSEVSEPDISAIPAYVPHASGTSNPQRPKNPKESDTPTSDRFQDPRFQLWLDQQKLGPRALKSSSSDQVLLSPKSSSRTLISELKIMIGKIIKEKDLVEKKMGEYKDVVVRQNAEIETLKLQNSLLQKQVTTLKEVTATALADLESNEKLREKDQILLNEKMDQLKEMRKQHNALSKELDIANENLQKNKERFNQLEDIKRQCHEEQLKKESECEELKQLHEDLLVAVKVANDIKTDCQMHLERMQLKVRELEETNSGLMDKLEKIQSMKDKVTVKPFAVPKLPKVPKLPPRDTTAASSVPPTTLKMSRPSLQSVDVKSIINTIENANKPTQSEPGSGSEAGSLQRETNPLPVITTQGTPVLDENKDCLLTPIEKTRGSKRNALLKWVQGRVQDYTNIEVTNFSSSWSNGLALCALLHTYVPRKIKYHALSASNKEQNFAVAFRAAESVGIPTILTFSDMIQTECPDWQKVLAYIKAIYERFEGQDSL